MSPILTTQALGMGVAGMKVPVEVDLSSRPPQVSWKSIVKVLGEVLTLCRRCIELVTLSAKEATTARICKDSPPIFMSRHSCKDLGIQHFGWYRWIM